MTEHQRDLQEELRYRRGYIHGFNAVVGALEDHLTEHERTKLQRHQQELLKWSAGGGHMEPPPTSDVRLAR